MRLSSGSPAQPTAGLWMHLEHDLNTGRPELRILVDPGTGGLDGLVPIPIYLDRPSVTEALADAKATTFAGLDILAGRDGFEGAGVDVRGGEPDKVIADLAEFAERYVAVAAYLSRPEADIRCLEDPNARPQRLRRPARDKRTWLVGFSDCMPA